MSDKQKPEFSYPVGNRIKYFRTLKGITVNKLANLAGISQSYLRDIELGNKNPTIETVYLICEALGISLKDFFDDNSQKNLADNQIVQMVYQLTPSQKNALTAFLQTMIPNQKNKKALAVRSVTKSKNNEE